MVPLRTLKVALTDMAHRGEALGRINGQVVFAAFGVPGEEVVVEVTRQRRDYLLGRVVEVDQPSEDRVSPPCPYFGRCGGCQLQHIAYQRQLALKTAVVQDQMVRIGGFTDPPVQPMLGARDPWGYRNHARFSVDGAGRLGYVSSDGTRYRFVQVDECQIMHPQINAALKDLQGKARESRQVSVRYGINTGQVLVQPRLREPTVETPTGQLYLEEQLLGRRFRISAASFFQVNPVQAERMVEVVRDRIAPRGTELLLDAYAGVGTFAILLAPYVDRVIAIEESPSAVEDARWNVEHAGLHNIDLMLGKVEHVLPDLDRRADVVILDPSRNGCHRKVLDCLVRFRPSTVVYVSCDPATLARDLRILVDGGYRLEEVQPIDMFPQTYHIECVSTLRWQGTWS
ncbi:MAG: 23S rRNA (uracil(1939)-C(5))-methyltransferase RlmD [Chloroflexi bacterium]|nr:23S rRNA (uracil(1939)-C(5))-methyltransferase RlmD [Chloroflexota bacterium]